MLKIAFSIHPTLLNKPQTFSQEFAKDWQRKAGSLQDLRAHVSKGGAFIPAAMSSGRRNSASFDSSSLAVVDVDNGLTINEYLNHPLICSTAWVYTSASHDAAAGKHRFRVIFQLPEKITDGDLYESIVNLLIKSLGGDANCSDRCRIFYGNDKTEHPHWQPHATLPVSILDDAREAALQKKARYNEQSADVDSHSINLAAYCLEHVLEPTSDGQRDDFCNITRAASTAGDALFPVWSDWASRGHHGKGKNSSQASEKWFRTWHGRSLATIFWQADQDLPGWRKSLPPELKGHTGDFKLGVYGDSFAGYAHEDFLGEADTFEPEEQSQGLFDKEKPWTQIAVIDRPEEDEEEELDSVPPDTTGLIPRRSNGRGNDEDQVERIKNLLNHHYNGLRLNCMNQQLTYGPHDKPQEIHDPSQAYIYISRGQNTVFPKTLVFDLAGVIGYEQRFHPVKAYLERCVANADPCFYFDRLATELLGVSEDDIQNPVMPCGNRLADVILKRFLVGAVARVLSPGCRHDWMPILIGSQNAGKTTFFQYLTPPAINEPGTYPWVVTMQQGIEYLKDKPHALHAGFIVVMDEFERYTKRKYSEELKNLVSVSIDRSARKYENEKSYPRAFVLAGATNNPDFLCDPTGNRRFMPITVEGKVEANDKSNIKIIDLDRLKRDRDSIWASAYRAYQDNPVHVFSSYELNHISDYADSFSRDNPVDALVARNVEMNCSGYYQHKQYITLSDLFQWIDINVSQHNQMTQTVTDCLKRLGYKPKRIKENGKPRRIWLKPD